MIEEDFTSRAVLRPPAPQLDQLSIEELEAKIERLQREIAECEHMISAKRTHRSAADALFGKAG